MEPLTFEQFEDRVMNAFEDWPVRCTDSSDRNGTYYSFSTVGMGGEFGFQGFYNGEWTVSRKENDDKGSGESIEEALEAAGIVNDDMEDE